MTRTQTDEEVMAVFLFPGVKGSGDENNGWSKKQKRKEGSPLLEMPDLSQTQKKSQASPCSSEALSLRLDSPQVLIIN